jgi:hypothetical protein
LNPRKSYSEYRKYFIILIYIAFKITLHKSFSVPQNPHPRGRIQHLFNTIISGILEKAMGGHGGTHL